MVADNMNYKNICVHVKNQNKVFYNLFQPILSTYIHFNFVANLETGSTEINWHIKENDWYIINSDAYSMGTKVATQFNSIQQLTLKMKGMHNNTILRG